MSAKLFVIVGVAAALIIAGLLYQTGSFAIEDPTQETFTTAQNLYLEPRQTEAANHPIQ